MLVFLKGKVLEMEKQYKVGIVGATGMVGQRFVTLLENHPWFKLTVAGCFRPQCRQNL